MKTNIAPSSLCRLNEVPLAAAGYGRRNDQDGRIPDSLGHWASLAVNKGDPHVT